MCMATPLLNRNHPGIAFESRRDMMPQVDLWLPDAGLTSILKGILNILSNSTWSKGCGLKSQTVIYTFVYTYIYILYHIYRLNHVSQLGPLSVWVFELGHIWSTWYCMVTKSLHLTGPCTSELIWLNQSPRFGHWFVEGLHCTGEVWGFWQYKSHNHRWMSVQWKGWNSNSTSTREVSPVRNWIFHISSSFNSSGLSIIIYWNMLHTRLRFWRC